MSCECGETCELRELALAASDVIRTDRFGVIVIVVDAHDGHMAVSCNLQPPYAGHALAAAGEVLDAEPDTTAG